MPKTKKSLGFEILAEAASFSKEETHVCVGTPVALRWISLVMPDYAVVAIFFSGTTGEPGG
jgi:hypothetical protein